MPAPLVLAGVAAVGAIFGALASEGVRTAGKAYLQRTLNTHRPEIEKWALSCVFERLGLPDLMDEGKLNQGAFTDAINSTFLAGGEFKFSNVFDRNAIRRDAMRFGVMQVGSEAGLQIEDVSEKGLTDALKGYMMKLVEEELTAQDVGELTQDAKDVYEIIKLYRSYKKAESDGEAAERAGRRPLINTPEAAANRERQARYRANHRKRWVPKTEGGA